MSATPQYFPAEVRASAKIRPRSDTSNSCREHASSDLLKAVTALTANERLILERSAASWSQRAELLERVETLAQVRIDNASQGARA